MVSTKMTAHSLVLFISIVTAFALGTSLTWADGSTDCPRETSEAIAKPISDGMQGIVSKLKASPSPCDFTDLSAFCSAREQWRKAVLYAKSQNPAPCQSDGDENAQLQSNQSPACVAAIKKKFQQEVSPQIKKIFDKIVNHSDFIQRCCNGESKCTARMKSVHLKLFPEQSVSTGYDEAIAPHDIAVGYGEAYYFDPAREEATIMHELGHACHETLVPVPYESGEPRRKAMEKLIADRFGKDYLSCVQEEFGKYFPNWQDPENYEAGINRVYNETFAEAFVAPIAPKIYQGESCYEMGRLSHYFASTACRFKIPRLKAEWCTK